MTSDETVDLIQRWDALSAAIDRVLTALPEQMTDAAKILAAERRSMRAEINRLGRKAAQDKGRPH